MSFNGSAYSVPAYGDTGWAAGPGNLSAYLVAIAAGSLQTTGGTFTLSADVNFGSTYGIIAKYLTTVTAAPATSGVVRLALTDQICWGAGNLALSVAGSRLYFNGAKLSVATEYCENYVAGTALNNYTGSLTLVNMVGPYLTNGVNLYVYVNGILQTITLDYAETSTTSITFTGGLNTGDRVSLRWAGY